jgi:hypothetical protein
VGDAFWEVRGDALRPIRLTVLAHGTVLPQKSRSLSSSIPRSAS